MINKMKKFGDIKSKMLTKLTESYSKQNKEEMKSMLNLIKENKDFKELYLFYEEIENKHFEDKEVAQLYVEQISSMLKERKPLDNKFINKLSSTLKDVEINENEVYNSLDMLCEEDSLLNIDKKVLSKKKLVDYLLTKKNVVENTGIKYVENEALLHSVLTNNFNVLYDNTLSESEKDELKNILSLSQEDLTNKTTELKESINLQIENLLKESSTDDLKNSLDKVKEEIKTMDTSKHNYYRLTQLKNGLI